MKEEVFFFEEKKQKTFTHWFRARDPMMRQVARVQGQKFFASFFPKEDFFLLGRIMKQLCRRQSPGHRRHRNARTRMHRAPGQI